MKASSESAGRSRSQHSQLGRIVSMARSSSKFLQVRGHVDVRHDTRIVHRERREAVAMPLDDRARAVIAAERGDLRPGPASESHPLPPPPPPPYARPPPHRTALTPPAP